tara:strand:- start:577 stop:816 length:240 start_codon:yes stop_codon:yes gene_type:complete
MQYDWDKSGSIDRAEVILLLQDLKQGGYMQMSDALFRRYVDMNWRKIDTGKLILACCGKNFHIQFEYNLVGLIIACYKS